MSARDRGLTPAQERALRVIATGAVERGSRFGRSVYSLSHGLRDRPVHTLIRLGLVRVEQGGATDRIVITEPGRSHLGGQA